MGLFDNTFNKFMKSVNGGSKTDDSSAELDELKKQYIGKKIVHRVIEIDFDSIGINKNDYAKTLTEIRKRKFGFRPYEIVWGDWGVTKFHNIEELRKCLEILGERPEIDADNDRSSSVIFVSTTNQKMLTVNDGTGWLSNYAFEDVAPTWKELSAKASESIKNRETNKLISKLNSL